MQDYPKLVISTIGINNGVSDRITLNQDGSSQFYGTMSFNNATSNNIVLNPNGSASFTNTLSCNDIDVNTGINIGKSSTLGYSINLGNPLGSIFPATMPTINLYGKVYFNSPDTILTNFNQF